MAWEKGNECVFANPLIGRDKYIRKKCVEVLIFI
jgi:hypothetical protein